MKTLTGIAAILILMTAPAIAQVSVGINLYAGAGYSSPTSDLNDITKNGFHYMAAAGYSPIPSFELTGRFAKHTLGFEGSDDLDFEISEYGADLRASLPLPGQRIKPFALIGAGAAKLKFPQSELDQLIDDLTLQLTGLEPKTKLYYSIGAGFKVNALPKLNFFLEGRYTRVNADGGDLNYFPITAGLNLSL